MRRGGADGPSRPSGPVEDGFVTKAILTLNAGSSSLKFALFAVSGDQVRPRLRGKIENIGAAPHMIARDADGATLVERRWGADEALAHEAFLEPLLAWVDDHLNRDRLAAIGHRVVHGGPTFKAPVIVSDAVLTKLDALSPMAPLHQPHNLAAIRAAQAARPNLPQIACFDTAFHSSHADVVSRFALPRCWHEQGVRRYGFHGLSYEYVAGRLKALDPELAAGRVLVAHLGAGASLCALKAGLSLDTTMGFTALDGLVMGTRCGALDPGVILYLQQQAGLTPSAIEDLLYARSGLLGVSGVSSDMRTLLASDEPNARQAIDLFVFRIAREAGALMSSLGGLDGVVFTGGIGENAAEIRRAVAERLAWSGLVLDQKANDQGAGRISDNLSKVAAWVIPTDEELMIARYVVQLTDA
jgi:acetate kinase